MKADSTVLNKRIEYAPDRLTRGHGTSGPLSVSLNPNEKVIWTWQHDINGNKFVTGYTITKKK